MLKHELQTYSYTLVDITRAEPVKEVPIGANVAVSNGYGESKWVGETILAEAAKQTPLRSTSISVGQLSGGINGAWTTAEWLPSLVRSAIHLKALPDCEGVSYLISVGRWHSPLLTSPLGCLLDPCECRCRRNRRFLSI